MAEPKAIVTHHDQSGWRNQPHTQWMTVCVRVLGFTAFPVVLSEVLWFSGNAVTGYILPILLPFLGYPIDLWWGKDQLFQRTTYYSWALWLVVACIVAWLTRKKKLGTASLVFVVTLMILSVGVHFFLRSLGYKSWLANPLF